MCDERRGHGSRSQEHPHPQRPRQCPDDDDGQPGDMYENHADTICAAGPQRRFHVQEGLGMNHEGNPQQQGGEGKACDHGDADSENHVTDAGGHAIQGVASSAPVRSEESAERPDEQCSDDEPQPGPGTDPGADTGGHRHMHRCRQGSEFTDIAPDDSLVPGPQAC